MKIEHRQYNEVCITQLKFGETFYEKGSSIHHMLIDAYPEDLGYFYSVVLESGELTSWTKGTLYTVIKTDAKVIIE